MVSIIETAMNLGRLNVPDNTLIDLELVKNYPENQTVIITTGSQGESMAALSRMASNMHKKISIGPGDTVIFSSHPIPGNEKAVSKVEGVTECSVSLLTNSMGVEGTADASAIIAAV